MRCKKCLEYGHIVKRCSETVANAETKDTTKVSAPTPKSDATTSKQTTKHSQRTAQYSKEKQKSSRSKQKNACPDYRPYRNFSD